MFPTVFRVYKQAYIEGIIDRWLQHQSHNDAITNLITQIHHAAYKFPKNITESHKVNILF